MGIAALGSALGASAANAAAVGAAAISTATAVASATATRISQSNAAKAQAEAQSQQNKMITEATIENYKDLSKAEQNVLYNAQQDSIENKIGALEAKSQAEAMASATGIRGRSSDMMLGNLGLKESKNEQSIQMNRDQQLYNINQQAIALRDGAEASYNNTPIRKPSMWTSVAQGASAGASMFQTTTSLEKAWGDSRTVK